MVEFKAKIKTMLWVDGTFAYQYVEVPVLKRKHCDMQAFRDHPRYGFLANSDLFVGVLAKIRKDIFRGPVLRLDQLIEGVEVNDTGFLAVITWKDQENV